MEKLAPGGFAFLLTQLGAHVAMGFAARAAEIGLTPPQAGILRLVQEMENPSQQALAGRIGLVPSRMVGLIDELNSKGLVDRQPKAGDRRVHTVVLTDKGKRILRQVEKAIAEHEAEITASLSPEECHQLTALCRKIADQQGLEPGVHPGLKHLRAGSWRAGTLCSDE